MEYQYYITKEPYSNGTQKKSDIPVIFKLKNDGFPITFEMTNEKEAEGPFDSIYELKKKSIIYLSVKLNKHKERILKNKNIIEIKDLIVTTPETRCDEAFFDSLHHTMVGKITKHKVKGVHFLDPQKVQITENIKTNNKTGVYSARLKKFDEITGVWIEKDEITNFFPDNWSVNRLFHECLYAYNNKKQISERIYESTTLNGINVKFIINELGKILTFYPIIDENNYST